MCRSTDGRHAKKDKGACQMIQTRNERTHSGFYSQIKKRVIINLDSNFQASENSEVFNPTLFF